MHTFAQRPKTPQQAARAKSTVPDRASIRQSPEAEPILHLQRTLRNRVVQRLLQANAEEDLGPVVADVDLGGELQPTGIVFVRLG